jgi:hypothetical protein
MAGRLAAPQNIIVHARQIVMNQRIGVYQLYRRSRNGYAPYIRTGKLTGSEG